MKRTLNKSTFLKRLTFEALFAFSVVTLSLGILAQGLSHIYVSAQSSGEPSLQKIYSNYFLNDYEYFQYGYIVGNNLTSMEGYGASHAFNIGLQLDNGDFRSFVRGALDANPPAYVVHTSSQQVIKFTIAPHTDLTLGLGFTPASLSDHFAVQVFNTADPNPNRVYISNPTDPNDDDLGIVDRHFFDSDRTALYIDGPGTPGTIRWNKLLYGADSLYKGVNGFIYNTQKDRPVVDIDYFNAETGAVIPIARDETCTRPYSYCLSDPTLWDKAKMTMDAIGLQGQIRMYSKSGTAQQIYSKKYFGKYYVSDDHDADQNDYPEFFTVTQIKVQNETRDDSTNWRDGDSWYKGDTKKIAIDVANSVTLPATVSVSMFRNAPYDPNYPTVIGLKKNLPVVQGRNQLSWTVGKDLNGNDANFDPQSDYFIYAFISSNTAMNRAISFTNQSKVFVRTATGGTVSTPADNSNIYWGDTTPITFDISGDEVPSFVKIEMSYDNGANWRTLEDGFVLTGSGPYTYNWTPVPTDRAVDRNTSEARIRISAEGALPVVFTSGKFNIGPHPGIDLAWNHSFGRNGLAFVPTVVNPSTTKVHVYAWLDANIAEGMQLPSYKTHIRVRAGFGGQLDPERLVEIDPATIVNEPMVDLGEFTYDPSRTNAKTFTYQFAADDLGWWEAQASQNADGNNVLQEEVDTAQFGVKLNLATSSLANVKAGVPGHDTVTLNMDLAGLSATPEKVASARFILDYSAATLQWVSGNLTPPAGYLLTVTALQPGKLEIKLDPDPNIVGGVGSTPITFPGLTFKAISSGAATFNVEWSAADAGDQTKLANVMEGQATTRYMFPNLGDILAAVTPDTGITFTIRPTLGTNSNQAPTYKTRLFDVRYRNGQIDPTAELQTLGVFTAAGESVEQGVSGITYAVKFYDGSTPPQVIYPENRSGFDADGFFATTNGQNLSTVLQGSWLANVRFIQMRVRMTTLDYETNTPKVKALSLGYELRNLPQESNIGAINFTSAQPYTFVVNPSGAVSETLNVASSMPSGQAPVTVKLEMNWTSNQAPTGVTATFLQNNVAKDTIENFGPGTTAQVVLKLQSTSGTPDGVYGFRITGKVVGGIDTLTPTPNANLQVISVSDFFINFQSPAERSITIGGNDSFPFSIVRDEAFNKTITLSTNVIDATHFGNDLASAKFYKDNTEVTQIQPTDFDAQNLVNLTLKVQAATQGVDKLDTPVSFKVSGTYDNGNINGKKIDSTNDGRLTIVSGTGDKTVTFKLNVPLQTNSSRNGITFKFRLYNEDTSNPTLVTEKTGLNYDNPTSSLITVNGLSVKTGSKYGAYVRSTRHAWRKAPQVTIGAPTSYDLTFAQLMAGDLAGNDTCRNNLQPDNKITTTDLVSFWPDYGKTGDGLPFDINGDGKVNFSDGQFILNQLTLKGDSLPPLTCP